MCNFVSYFVCVILCIFVFLCDILLPSGVINDDNIRDVKSQTKNGFIPMHCGSRVVIMSTVTSYLYRLQAARRLSITINLICNKQNVWYTK